MSGATARTLSHGHLGHQQVFDAPEAAHAEPTLISELMKLIGVEAAALLVRDFGGTRLYVPNAPMAHDVVTRSIGLIAAVKLARTFGGDRVLIPSPTAQLRRPAQILAMRSREMSVAAIARELRCTERYVYKVLAGTRSYPRPSRLAPKHRAGHAHT